MCTAWTPRDENHLPEGQGLASCVSLSGGPSLPGLSLLVQWSGLLIGDHAPCFMRPLSQGLRAFHRLQGSL